MNTLIQSILFVLFFISIPLVNARWKPVPGLKWNWDLKDDPNKISPNKGEFDVIDIDLYGASKSVIDKFHDLGLKVICYTSAGTYEPFREEAKVMKNVKGLVRDQMDDWDEYWLDFRHEEIKPIMTERLDLAKSKGCDGMEFDNVNAYSEVDWSDKLTKNDQIKYNRWLAQEAHNRDMSAGLKNAVELIDDLKDDFDFAINEQCADYSECKRYAPFINQNKAVFVALYGRANDSGFVKKACSQIDGLNLSVIIKNPDQTLKYEYTCLDQGKYCPNNAPVKEAPVQNAVDPDNASKMTTTVRKTTTTTVKKTFTTTTRIITTTTVKPRQITTTSAKPVQVTTTVTKRIPTTTNKPKTTTNPQWNSSKYNTNANTRPNSSSGYGYSSDANNRQYPSSGYGYSSDANNRQYPSSGYGYRGNNRPYYPSGYGNRGGYDSSSYRRNWYRYMLNNMRRRFSGMPKEEEEEEED